MKNEKDMIPLVSGHVSLDFINTEVVRRNVRHDLLQNRNDLACWIQAIRSNRTLHPGQANWNVSEWSEAWFLKCKEFRETVRSGFEQIACKKHVDADFIETMEKQIKVAPFGYAIFDEELVALPIGEDVDQLLSLIAYDVLFLFHTKDLLHIRTCHNPDCVLLFIDSNGRRKWCSMKICGNRTKVARHQGKQASVLQVAFDDLSK